MLQFRDILYGHLELPDWMLPFLKLPEFVRLRGVRLSNVDSVYFKDFSGPTRWEHGIAVAALAHRCALRRGLTEQERVHLSLAALLHDVGTPPFAHTAESVLANFDHELEGERLLTARTGADFSPDVPVFQSQLPQFQKACESLARQLRLRIDPDEVARYIGGEGDLGFLINGAIDLDNADNVTRSSMFLGFKVRSEVPLGVADWLARQTHPVSDLDSIDDEAVREWIVYRNQLYTAFFEADVAEVGRMAFLQHLMRRALDAGVERSQLIWLTDDELMNAMARLDDTPTDEFRPALRELVQRYRLLETPICAARVAIEDAATLRVLRHPDAIAWITKRLRSERFEPMVLVMSRRFPGARPTTLLPDPAGTLYVFHVGSERRVHELEKQLQTESAPSEGKSAPIADVLSKAVRTWAAQKPWSVANNTRCRNVTAALDSVGDWGFRLSRNNGFHAYPSTFVHALPANLLVALGMRDDMVLDPFGGTGQTAIEAVKYGNNCVIADANTIACLVAKARLVFLPSSSRGRVRSLDQHVLRTSRPTEPPLCELLDEWFHPRTRDELSRILGFIQERHDHVLQTFLKACFSAILPSCTARRGEQHGYFADNCPLPRHMEEPPYQPAIDLFLERTTQALASAERLYGFLEREGRNPEEELSRVIVKQADVSCATPETYGLTAGTVGAVITSPPYLCMADYALGQRLSYEWLAPTLLSEDFDKEIGARRLRLKRRPETVIAAYYKGLNSFAALAAQLVRTGGYVAVILGQPAAKEYRDANAADHLDKALKAGGFEQIWQRDRVIHWHRNHGYARLKKERVSVHVKK